MKPTRNFWTLHGNGQQLGGSIFRRWREEFNTAGSELSAAKIEKSTLKDKEEIRDLSGEWKRLFVTQAQMEKFRKDARQRKDFSRLLRNSWPLPRRRIINISNSKNFAQSELEIIQIENAVVDAKVAELPRAVSPATGCNVHKWERAPSHRC
jgi:hypothetical protein